MTMTAHLQSVLAASLATDLFAQAKIRSIAFPDVGSEHHTFNIAYYCIADVCDAFIFLALQEHGSLASFLEAWGEVYCDGTLAYEFSNCVVQVIQEQRLSLFEADTYELASLVLCRLRKDYQAATTPLVTTLSNILLPTSPVPK